MTTSRSNDEKERPASPTIYPRGAAQVEAERLRLGITQEHLERSRDASLNRKF